jgi:hypothetical protein
MKLDLFANRLFRAHASGGVVRLEFGVAVDDKGELAGEGTATPGDEVTFTVNMPLAGFGRSLAVLRQLAQDLQLRAGPRRTEGGGPRGGGGRRLPDLTRDDEGGDGGDPGT